MATRRGCAFFGGTASAVPLFYFGKVSVLAENWKFRKNIATKLEEIGRRIIGSTFISVDEICNGQFVYAMLQVLSIFYDNEEISDFCELCYPLEGMLGREIEREKVEEAFEEFKRLVRNKRKKWEEEE